MNRIFGILCLVQLVEVLRGELSLQITKNVNGTEIPVTHLLRETAGTNLTLTCRLVGTDGGLFQPFDDELSWGWKRQNVQFKNSGDLENLAADSSQPLRQFLNTTEGNQAAITFHPLFPVDAGKYFCMSLKYNLFNLVKIKLIRDSKYDGLSKYHQMLSTINGPKHLGAHNGLVQDDVAVPKSSFACTDGMFVCNSRTSCLKYENVCDNVTDCDDGSDENAYLCGNNPCADKSTCSTGRCILESVCCDHYVDLSCISSMQSACCAEITERKHRKLEDMINSALKNTKGTDDSTTLEPNVFEYALDDQTLVNNAFFIPNLDKELNDSGNIEKVDPIISNKDDLFSQFDKFVPSEDYWKSIDDDKKNQDALRDAVMNDLSSLEVYTFKPDIEWHADNHYSSVKMYTAVISIPTLILLVALRCRRYCLRDQSRLLLCRISTLTVLVPRNSENENASSESTTQEGSSDRPEELHKNDLPPSYDEAVVNVPQTTSLLS